MWLIVLSLSPHNLLFCCVLSIFAWTWCCFVLLSEEIYFLFLDFFFLVISKFSGVRFRLFVTEISIQLFFFLFLFPDYFRSVDAFVVCVVSGGYNLSSCAFLMYSSSFCIDGSTLSWMLVSPLTPSFLDTFIIIIYSLRICHITVSWWSFTEVWVIASL